MAYDYGSGALGSYSTLTHGVSGNFATANVGLVGDSITTRGYGQLAALLTPLGKTLATDYWSGRPTTPAVTSTIARPVLPKILVMATGTNDIFNPMVMAAQIARMQAAPLPGVEHLIWVDVQCCRTAQTAKVQLADQRNTQLVNTQIHDAFDVTHIVDWNRWLMYRGPAFLTTYLQDGVHPWISKGTQFWASILMTRIKPFL